MKDLDFDKPNEHIDYKLIPAVSDDGTEEWHCEFLRAPFNDHTVRFGNIKYDGEEQSLKFNFEVVDGVLTHENTDLQQFATDVLQDILVAAYSDGSLKTKESNGNQSGTDDSTESTD